MNEYELNLGMDTMGNTENGFEGMEDSTNIVNTQSSNKSIVGAAVLGGTSLILTGIALWKFRKLKKKLEEVECSVDTVVSSVEETEKRVDVVDDRLTEVEDVIDDLADTETELLNQRITMLLIQIKEAGASAKEMRNIRKTVTSITDWDKAVDYLNSELERFEDLEIESEESEEVITEESDEGLQEEEDFEEDEIEEEEEDSSPDAKEDVKKNDNQKEKISNSNADNKQHSKNTSNNKNKEGIIDDSNNTRNSSDTSSEKVVHKSNTTNTGKSSGEKKKTETSKKSMVINPAPAVDPLTVDELIEKFGDSLDLDTAASIIHLSQNLDAKDWKKVYSKLNKIVGYKNIWNRDQLNCKIISITNDAVNLPSMQEVLQKKR